MDTPIVDHTVEAVTQMTISLGSAQYTLAFESQGIPESTLRFLLGPTDNRVIAVPRGIRVVERHSGDELKPDSSYGFQIICNIDYEVYLGDALLVELAATVQHAVNMGKGVVLY